MSCSVTPTAPIMLGMATLKEKIEAERVMRELLDRNGMPAPDAVEYGYECIRFYWHETKTVVVVDLNEGDGRIPDFVDLRESEDSDKEGKNREDTEDKDDWDGEFDDEDWDVDDENDELDDLIPGIWPDRPNGGRTKPDPG